MISKILKFFVRRLRRILFTNGAGEEEEEEEKKQKETGKNFEKKKKTISIPCARFTKKYSFTKEKINRETLKHSQINLVR